MAFNRLKRLLTEPLLDPPSHFFTFSFCFDGAYEPLHLWWLPNIKTCR